LAAVGSGGAAPCAEMWGMATLARATMTMSQA
jgi:hypothetical protein